MAKTITLRLSDSDAELVEKLKHHLGESTASKTILHCVRQFGIHERLIYNLNQAIENQRNASSIRLWED